MARWRMHVVLLVTVLVIAALATWRLAAYPPEMRAVLAWQRPVLGLRALQVAGGLAALICAGLVLRDRLTGDEAGGPTRRYNWLCPGCNHIVEAERDECPFCGAQRTGLSKA